MEKKQTAIEWLIEKIDNEDMGEIPMWVYDYCYDALEMEKEQKGYTKEDVIKIVEKSRETGLTAEYLLLTFKSE